MKRIYTFFITLFVLLSQFSCDNSYQPDEQAQALPFDLINLAEEGKLQQVQHLLSTGSFPDIKNSCQWTPLMKAAQNGHFDVVKALLEKGAYVEQKDKGSYTALLLAASGNHAQIVELLIQHGANIDHQEQTMGWSALIWASKLNHIDTVKVLLNHQANQQLTDLKGLSALDWAIEIQSDTLIHLFEQSSFSNNI